MKNVIFLLFIASSFFSYSQDKDSALKGIFKDYQALTASKEVSRKKAINFLKTAQGMESPRIPKNASYKIVTLKLKEEERVLFILSGDNLYLFADRDILVSADDAPPIDQPEPKPDPIPRPKPDPTPTPTPTPDPTPTPPDDEEPEPRDGQSYPIICCGKTYYCANTDDECNCAREAPNCKEGENKLFFEMLAI